MKLSKTTLAAIGCVHHAGPALASPCSDGIQALETRLDRQEEAAISTSSPGQGVAGAREGQAMEAARGNPPDPVPAAPFQDRGREAKAVGEATAAGGGGDQVMQAKVAINRARTADARGDAAACQEALAEAGGMLERK